MLVFFFFFFFFKKSFLSKKCSGISLVVQWLRRHAPNAGRLGSIPGMHMYSLLYLKWITNKDLLFSTGNCSMLCGSLDGRGVWGRVDICICMAESLHCSPGTITALLTGNTPIQNNKFRKDRDTGSK